jgi:hypothetical protein
VPSPPRCRCRWHRRRFRRVTFRSPALQTAPEIPRTDEFEACRFEVRQVPGRQAAAVDARNGGDHSVGRGHGSALSERCTHDVAVGERGGLRKGEDPVGKTVAPGGQSLLQARGPLVGANFPMPKAISAIVTAGNASSASLRTSQAITAGFGVLRSVSDMTFVSRKIKAPVPDGSFGVRE